MFSILFSLTFGIKMETSRKSRSGPLDGTNAWDRKIIDSENRIFDFTPLTGTGPADLGEQLNGDVLYLEPH